VLVGEMSKPKRCGECGAELKLGPATCPLCGHDTEAPAPPAAEVDPDEYHSNLRQLRDELRKLRSEDLKAS